MSEEGEITSEDESNCCEQDHLSKAEYSKDSTSAGVVGSIGPSSFTPSRPNFSASFFRPHHQAPPLPIFSSHFYHPTAPPSVQSSTSYPPYAEYPLPQQQLAAQQLHFHQNQPFMTRQQLPVSPNAVNPAVPKKLKRLNKRGSGVKAASSNKAKSLKMLQFLCNPRFLSDFQEQLSERIKYLDEWLVKINYSSTSMPNSESSSSMSSIVSAEDGNDLKEFGALDSIASPVKEPLPETVSKPQQPPSSLTQRTLSQSNSVVMMKPSSSLIIDLNEDDESSIYSDDLESNSDDDEEVSMSRRKARMSRMPKEKKTMAWMDLMPNETKKPEQAVMTKSELESQFELHQSNLSLESEKMQQLLIRAQSLQSQMLESEKSYANDRRRVQELQDQLVEAKAVCAKSEEQRRVLVIQIASCKESIRKQESKVSETMELLKAKKEALETLSRNVVVPEQVSSIKGVADSSAAPLKPKGEQLADLERHLTQVRKDLLNNRLNLLEKTMAKQQMKLAQADKQRKKLGLSPIRVPTTRLKVMSNLGNLVMNSESLLSNELGNELADASASGDVVIDDWLALNVPERSTISFAFLVNGVYLQNSEIMTPSDIAKRLISLKHGRYEDLNRFSHVEGVIGKGSMHDAGSDEQVFKSNSSWESIISKLKTFHLHPQFWRDFSMHKVNNYFRNRCIDPSTIVCRSELVKRGSCKDKKCSFLHLQNAGDTFEDDGLIQDMMSYLFDPIIISLHGRDVIDAKVKEAIDSLESHAVTLKEFGCKLADTFATLLQGRRADLFYLKSSNATAKSSPEKQSNVTRSSEREVKTLVTEPVDLKNQDFAAIDMMEIDDSENVIESRDSSSSTLKGIEYPFFVDMLQELLKSNTDGSHFGRSSRYFDRLSSEQDFEAKIQKLGQETDVSIWLNYALSTLPTLSYENLSAVGSKLDKTLSTLVRAIECHPLNEGLHLLYLQLMCHRSSTFDAIQASKNSLKSVPFSPMIWWHLFLLQEDWKARLSCLKDMIVKFSDGPSDQQLPDCAPEVLLDAFVNGIRTMVTCGKIEEAKGSLFDCLFSNTGSPFTFQESVANHDSDLIEMILNRGTMPNFSPKLLEILSLDRVILLFQIYRHLLMFDDIPDECMFEFPFHFILRRDLFTIEWSSCIVAAERDAESRTLDQALQKLTQFICGSLLEQLEPDESVAVLLRCHLNHIQICENGDSGTAVMECFSSLNGLQGSRCLAFRLLQMDFEMALKKESFNESFQAICGDWPLHPVAYHKYAKFLLESDSFDELSKCLFYALSLPFNDEVNLEDGSEPVAMSPDRLFSHYQRIYGFPVHYSFQGHVLKEGTQVSRNDLFSLLHFISFGILVNVNGFEGESKFSVDYQMLYQLLHDGISHLSLGGCFLQKIIWVPEVYQLSANLDIFTIGFDTKRAVFQRLMSQETDLKLKLPYGYINDESGDESFRLGACKSYDVANSLIRAFEESSVPGLVGIYAELVTQQPKNVDLIHRCFGSLVKSELLKQASMVAIEGIRHNPHLTSLWALWLVFRQDIVKVKTTELLSSYLLLCKYLQPYWFDLNEKFLEFMNENQLKVDWVQAKAKALFPLQ